MSAIQSGSRRHSARLQQKDDHDHATDGTSKAKAQNTKKRKHHFEEDDDGFVFTRTKNKQTRASIDTESAKQVAPTPAVEVPAEQPDVRDGRSSNRGAPIAHDQTQQPPKERRKRRMSFSTPGKKNAQPVRRSKRLSTDAEDYESSPVAKQQPPPVRSRKEKVEKPRPPATKTISPKKPSKLAEKSSKVEQKLESTQQALQTQQEAFPPDNVRVAEQEESHSSTKISLPFADTPVISRNKAMREGKAGKSDRRSSLGLRGRRASSLIDSGTSNAVPHNEVQIADFYKHIESDLIEPRRMRQLLTWCATRATHPKPKGTSFEESSATSAARVIEEELLKDLANRSELSDWFSREEIPAPVMPLPERPHPKNAENAAKIVEVEEQLRRLRAEKEALEALLRPPSVGKAIQPSKLSEEDILNDIAEEERCMRATLQKGVSLPAEMGSRVNQIINELGPIVDTFADGVHKINQYRMAADDVASRVLATCAEKLTERELAGRKQALGSDEYNRTNPGIRHI